MNQRLYVATRKGLFVLAPDASASPAGETTWTIQSRSFLGNPVTIVFPDDRHGVVYAALELGHFGVKLHRSTDGCATWHESPCPEYPERPADATDVDPFRKEPVPWTVKKIWALAGGGADAPDRLWCGTIPGGLFVSEDRGESWSLVRSLWDNPARAEWFGGGYDWPGIHSICVDPRDSNVVRVGVSCGGVWQSNDAGANWKCVADGMRAAYVPPEQANSGHIQDPHLIAQCPNEPDIFWAQHHNGIFVTENACESWQEVKEPAVSDFGFAVVVHPVDGNTAWFVPGIKDDMRIPVDAKLVVTRTKDGGKSFSDLRNGLPQSDAYGIVYRHAMDVAADGSHLAFGTTTGSLFVTNNGGDDWQRVSADLPPIYDVKFAG